MLLTRRDRSLPETARRRLREALPAGPAAPAPTPPIRRPLRPPSAPASDNPESRAHPAASPDLWAAEPIALDDDEPDIGAEPADRAAAPSVPDPPPADRERWWSGSAGLLGLRNALLDPGRRGLRALVVVALAVVVVAGLVAWRLRPVADPVAAPATPVATPSAAVPSPRTASVARLVVAVAGHVRHPGLVRLPAGSRVADAIRAAGGPLPGTDLGFLNLARKVVDGEQILVGVTAPPQPAGPAAAAGTAAPTAPVNLNTATLAQLDTLPGIGPALAGRILTYRTEHGGFRSVDELKQVSGIGDARFQDLKDLVTV